MKTRRFLTIGGLLGGWVFILSIFAYNLAFDSRAYSLTNIAGSDTLSASRSVINSNFAGINQELTYNDEAVTWTLNSATAFRIYNSSGSSTVLTVDSASGSTTVAGMMYASNFYATSTTATSSFLGGLIAGQALRLSGANFASCNLDTDSNGYLQCGADATGGTDPNVTYGLVSATKYYQASTTATDNLSWRFGNGYVSQASSTITSTLTINALTSAVLLTDAAGTLAEYAGASCTNQFIRSLSALAAATCASVSLTLDITGTLPIANGGTNNTSFSIGNVWFNGTGLVATGSQFTVGNLVASTTATSTFANSPLQVGSGIIKDAMETKTFSIFATSSSAYYSTNASMTPRFGLTFPISIRGLTCRANNGGTFNAVAGTGAATGTMQSVTGTKATTAYTLAVTDAQEIILELGTFSGSPTGYCTLNYYRTN